MCLRPWTVAMPFSSLRATSFSSWLGAAPGRLATTVTMGRSMSGKFCTFIAWKENSPASVSMTNSIAAGIGLRMDQADTFMAGSSVRDLDQVTLVQEAGTLHGDPVAGFEPVHRFHPVPGAPAGG